MPPLSIENLTQFGGLLFGLYALWAVVSGRLRLEREVLKAEQRADRWEQFALSLLGITERAVMPAAIRTSPHE